MVKEIVVVGGGIIGLSATLAIAERTPSSLVHITVLAQHLPDDPNYVAEYTSAWAGAHFRPFPDRSPEDIRHKKWTRDTQKYFKSLAKSSPESSVTFIEGIEYLEAPDKHYQEIAAGWSDEMDDFEILSEDEVKLERAKMGVKYKTWVLNPPIYLNYLLRKLKFEYSVDFVKATVTSLKQLFTLADKKVDIVVNCSGLGLQYNGGYDPKCYPIRGQTLLIRPPTPFEQNPLYMKTITRQDSDNGWSFIIPRPLNGGVIIGGTKQPNDYFNKPRESDTKYLLEKAAINFPELMKIDSDGTKYFDVCQTNVGFRPARESGFRVEVEKHGPHKIVHAYGAGGMGYELSHGAAFDVAKKVDELLSTSKI